MQTGLPTAAGASREGGEQVLSEEKGLSPSCTQRHLHLSLAGLRDMGVDPRRCYLRGCPAAAGMGDVRVHQLLAHLPAAPPKLPHWLPQEQRELESAGKEGLGRWQMLAALAWAQEHSGW